MPTFSWNKKFSFIYSPVFLFSGSWRSRIKIEFVQLTFSLFLIVLYSHVTSLPLFLSLCYNSRFYNLNLIRPFFHNPSLSQILFFLLKYQFFMLLLPFNDCVLSGSLQNKNQKYEIWFEPKYLPPEYSL